VKCSLLYSALTSNALTGACTCQVQPSALTGSAFIHTCTLRVQPSALAGSALTGSCIGQAQPSALAGSTLTSACTVVHAHYACSSQHSLLVHSLGHAQVKCSPAVPDALGIASALAVELGEPESMHTQQMINGFLGKGWALWCSQVACKALFG